MRGLIDRNHGLGKYNVDLASRFDYRPAKEEIDDIDERIAELDDLIAEKITEIEEINAERVTLRAFRMNIIGQQFQAWIIAYENSTLDAMPESEERDDLEKRKEVLEEWVEDNNIEEQLAEADAAVAAQQALVDEAYETYNGMPEGEEKEAYRLIIYEMEDVLDGLQDDAVDIGEPIDEIEDIDRQLEEMPDGEERDEVLERIATAEEELAELEVAFEDLKDDVRGLDLEINLDGSLEEMKRAALDELGELNKERKKLIDDVLRLQLEKAGLELKEDRAEVRSETTAEILIYDIWCADLTVDLTGFIGIIEVVGTPSSDEYSEDTDSDESEALENELTELDEKIADVEKQMDGMEEGPEKSNLRLRVVVFELRKEKIENDREYEKRNHSDEIDTLNINDGFNIQPGYEGAAAYDETRDGTPTPDTYKYGIITTIDYNLNTCTVNLGSQVNGLE